MPATSVIRCSTNRVPWLDINMNIQVGKTSFNHLYILVDSSFWFDENKLMIVLFDLILYVPSTIFQLNRMGLPGLNQY